MSTGLFVKNDDGNYIKNLTIERSITITEKLTHLGNVVLVLQ